jgi:hypothetical protein
MADQSIKTEDLQMLLSMNLLAAEQLKTIAATRERDELQALLAAVKVCQCEGTQLPLMVDIAS